MRLRLIPILVAIALSACRVPTKADGAAALADFDLALAERRWDAAKASFARDTWVYVAHLETTPAKDESIPSDVLIERQAKALSILSAYERRASEPRWVIDKEGLLSAMRDVEEFFSLPDGRSGDVQSERGDLVLRHS